MEEDCKMFKIKKICCPDQCGVIELFFIKPEPELISLDGFGSGSGSYFKKELLFWKQFSQKQWTFWEVNFCQPLIKVSRQVTIFLVKFCTITAGARARAEADPKKALQHNIAQTLIKFIHSSRSLSSFPIKKSLLERKDCSVRRLQNIILKRTESDVSILWTRIVSKFRWGSEITNLHSAVTNYCY